MVQMILLMAYNRHLAKDISTFWSTLLKQFLLVLWLIALGFPYIEHLLCFFPNNHNLMLLLITAQMQCFLLR